MTVEFSNTSAGVWNVIQSALQEAGFIVANVSSLDKKRGGLNAIVGNTAVKQDLAISAVDTVSTAFMGMTVGCAKCHDHMFDPISQTNFYSMKALFDPLVLRKVTLASASDLIAVGKAEA